MHLPKSKIWLVCTVLMALLLSACGELTPTGKDNQLLINEVFTGATQGGTQWVELLNNTNEDIPLSGYQLATRYGTLDLGTLATAANRGTLRKGSTIVFSNNPQEINNAIFKLLQDSAETDETRAKVARPALPLTERTVLGKLDPNKDLLVLKGPNGLLDQLGWGNPDQDLRNQLGASGDLNLNLPAPANDSKSLGRTPYFGQRPATDPGEIDPGVFTLHNTPTPGPNTTPRAFASYHPIFTRVTDVITTLGALLLWAAFFIIALVARRFETLAEQKTYWQALMVAPSGILIYAIIQVQQFLIEGRLTDFWSWPAFLALFMSGVACVYVINIFRLIAKNILEAE